MVRNILQKLILFLFIIVIVLGLSDIKSISEFNYLTNYAVWYIWWPFMMVISLLSIRFWCMVCPLRTISELYSKYSFGLRIPKIMYKYKLLSMVLIFMILHATVVTLAIDRLPITTAIYLLVLLQYSALMALIFKKKSFCSVFCPLGGIMYIFSRVGLIKLGPNNKNQCHSCNNKTCGENCPVSLSPQELPSEFCVFCTNCMKSCSKNNIVFYRENPLKYRSRVMGKGEILSIIILLGIAITEFVERLEEMAVPGGNWNLIPGKIIGFIPDKLSQIGINPYGFKMFLIVWDYLIIPLFVVFTLTVILRVILFRKSFIYHLNNLATSIVPLIFAIFLAVLINYPLTLFYTGPGLVRKVILLMLLLLGLIASLYIFFRNLLYDPTGQTKI